MILPLKGVRILAVEQYGAGPFGTQHLADLGAEIIKIENPNNGGDIGRHVGPYYFEPADSHFFEAFNRNKRSITLDLKKDEGKKVLRKLVLNADVLFNNLRGDLPEKLSITYDNFKSIKPDLVCVHLSAYGRTGSRSNWPGYDYLMQAEAGYLSVTGDPSSPPARFGLSVVDYMTGTTAAMSILAGVIGARNNGEGGDIDVSLFDVALHNLAYLATWYLNEGKSTDRQPRSAHPSLTPSQLYKTSDGWVFIMCNKEKFWELLVDKIGKPEWKNDSRFHSFDARLENRTELQVELDNILKNKSTEEWIQNLSGIVPVAPVYNIKEALENKFVKENNSILEVSHPTKQKILNIASPVRIQGENRPAKSAPGLGKDTINILQESGFSKSEIKTLKNNSII